MARKVLYLITKPAIDDLLKAAPATQETWVVLLQGAVRLQKVPGNKVYVLQNEHDEEISSPFSSITYKDFISLIFKSDQVVAL